MSSSGVVAKASGGAVGLQTDLPGLASLVLNLGAAGLKRYAQAGVDFHTILCMGKIAEKCPASIEYRRELSARRQEQRKESVLLFRLVELGSATNFVADELLKNRAGENIIALMSTILPLMSEEACDILLLKLFEASGAPLDETPGFGQLRSLRESLLPLARKTKFKDKVFQYHVHARRLLRDPKDQHEAQASVGIPDEKTAVQLILSMLSLVQDNALILNFYGLKGAGLDSCLCSSRA